MKKIYVDLPIKAELDTIWQHTQDPALHVRWDLRFTDIHYIPKQDEADPTRFSYQTRLGFGLAIKGEGVSIAQGRGRNRTSVLQFSTEDWKSLITEGEGSWMYLPAEGRIRFRTVYDYNTRYGFCGRVVDRLLFRPLMRWATAWSFDRLRIWLENGIPPEASFLLWLVFMISKSALAFVWIWEGLVPKMLFPSIEEIRMVESTGLAWWDAASFIPFLGMCEVFLGIALLLGILPRIAAAISLLMLLFFVCILPWYEPALLIHPYGAITKNVGLIACSTIMLLLANRVPRSSRCNFKQGGRND